MAIKNLDELRSSVADIIGDRADDTAIAFIEDFNDTLADLSAGVSSDELDVVKSELAETKAKYEALDNEWRERYKKRFFSTAEEQAVYQTTYQDPGSLPEPLTYDALFKEE